MPGSSIFRKMNLFLKFILGGEPALYMKHVLVPTTTFLLSARSKWTDASKSFDRNRVSEADADKVNKAFDDWKSFHYDPNSPTHAMCRVINARAYLDIVKSICGRMSELTWRVCMQAKVSRLTKKFF